MSSHPILTQSKSARHENPRASVGLFDQAIVTAAVIAIAYIAGILVGWL
jgi:hypothetical protein